jgi:hypothetical protein
MARRYEIHTFTVNRSANRVRQNAMKTDTWIPLLFAIAYDGKRVKKEEGQISEISETSIKIRYQSSRKKVSPEERPTIVLWWSEIDKRNTKVQLKQLALPPAPDCWSLMVSILLLSFSHCKAKRVVQNRKDCYEELELLLSC